MYKRKLKIAQLVLPWIALPPRGYAGTERIVYSLTEGLVKRGHDVTLFSVGESKTSAKLGYLFPKAFGLQEDIMSTLKSSFYPLMHVAHCFEQQAKFDIIHSHAQFLGLPFAAVAQTPTVHTFHILYEFKNQDETDLVNQYKNQNFISISNSQRVSGIKYIATVYNGTDTNLYIPTSTIKRDYLLWVGRLIEKKGPEDAIKVAKDLNLPLIIAAKITEPDYFENVIKPQIDGKKIKFIDEVTQDKIVNLYQNALATVMPTKWNEPFGLVSTESMSCGTPVVGYANGGVKETVLDGKTGYLVEEKNGIKALIEKIQLIKDMSESEYAHLCQNARSHVVDLFSNEKMVEAYESEYYKLLQKKI